MQYSGDCVDIASRDDLDLYVTIPVGGEQEHLQHFL